MIRIDVNAGQNRYPIFIEYGLAPQLGRLLEQSNAPKRRFFISSPLVWKFHGKTLSRAVPKTEPILLPDGERHKQLVTVSRAYESLIKLEADRGSGVVAVGGG